ncbi:unnamed protein product, partial [Lampetra planeri]
TPWVCELSSTMWTLLCVYTHMDSVYTRVHCVCVCTLCVCVHCVCVHCVCVHCVCVHCV